MANENFAPIRRVVTGHRSNNTAAVLIDGGTIKQVGAPLQVQRNAPVDAALIDLGGATLLPGLIDGHTHLLLDVIVRGVRVGHPFSVALALVAKEMPDPIGTEFGMTSDEIAFTSVNLSRFLQLAGAERAPLTPTATSSFVLLLVPFVSARCANVLFWYAFHFHQFALTSRQN